MRNILNFSLCSYLQYSRICAMHLRRALKPELRAAEVEKKESTIIRAFKWSEGKPAPQAGKGFGG